MLRLLHNNDQASVRKFCEDFVNRRMNNTEGREDIINTMLSLVDTASPQLVMNVREIDYIAKAVSEKLQLVDCLYHLANHELSAEAVALLHLNTTKNTLRLLVAGDAESQKRRTTFPITGIISQVIRTGKSVSVVDVSTNTLYDATFDSELNPSGTDSKSAICVPVKNTKGDVVGVIFAINKIAFDRTISSFCNVDVELMEMFSESISSMVDKLCATVEFTETKIERPHKRIKVNGHIPPRVLQVLPIENVSLFQISIDKIRSYDFSPLDYTHDQLIHIAHIMMEDIGVFDSAMFKVNKPNLGSFFRHVLLSYRDNPYHNFYHGFCVFHFSYLFLSFTGLRHSEDIPSRVVFDDVSIFSVLLASLCHDIEHPGNNNMYEVQLKSPLALRYNDISVLENHHAYVTLELLRRNDLQLLENMSDDETSSVQRAMRCYIIHSILATDMTQHLRQVANLEKMHSELTSFDGKNKSKMDDILTLVDLIVHAGDLSGQVLPLHIAVPWEELVCTEFKQQARNERYLGLTLTPSLQNLEDEKVRITAHLGFIDAILQPFWTQVCKQFPMLSSCLDRLAINRRHFEEKRTAYLNSLK